MGATLKALEVRGTIDEQRRLHLDAPLPIVGPSRVRVIILILKRPTLTRGSGVRQQPGTRRLISSKRPKQTFTREPMGNRFMTRGKVVLLPFPFDDLSAAKVRPAVCLTHPIGR